MGLKNLHASFDDGIFGPKGIHPTPKELPYPKRPLKTILGDTFEYIIPPEDKIKVLRELYPFDNLPTSRTKMRDAQSGDEFLVRDYKVVEQNGYVMPVSPYFAKHGSTVVDWEVIKGEKENFFESRVMIPELASAFNAGYGDGFIGRDDGTNKPVRKPKMKYSWYQEIEDAYEEGFGMGFIDRRKNKERLEEQMAAARVRRKKRRPKK